jgi:hypothetical protein
VRAGEGELGAEDANLPLERRPRGDARPVEAALADPHRAARSERRVEGREVALVLALVERREELRVDAETEVDPGGRGGPPGERPPAVGPDGGDDEVRDAGRPGAREDGVAIGREVGPVKVAVGVDQASRLTPCA